MPTPRVVTVVIARSTKATLLAATENHPLVRPNRFPYIFRDDIRIRRSSPPEFSVR
jgi:hypothetical protein